VIKKPAPATMLGPTTVKKSKSNRSLTAGGRMTDDHGWTDGLTDSFHSHYSRATTYVDLPTIPLLLQIFLKIL